MAQEHTAARVRKLIIEYAGVAAERITAEAHLYEDLGIDSLEKVELVMAAEEEFNVLIDDDQARSIETVADCIRVIDAAETW